HHSMILMVEDMAVEHPASWIVVVPHDETQRLVLRHVHDVRPGAKRFWNAVAIDHLELEAVKVEGMIHPYDVLDPPDLRRSQRPAFIDSMHVHRLAVDKPLTEHNDMRRRRLRGVEHG